eukprot:TRINITY_DN6023_c0_g1_i1.p1 TRINITY_DN6023_c0_g1~~TRINITY_DN6023_c0_g1_i1.p1  ORF type:complete len:114 (-),score=14.05 TRINITY_DN6023_c0_g1_i1:148-489(-)
MDISMASFAVAFMALALIMGFHSEGRSIVNMNGNSIPSTLDGPFKPVTVPLDPNLRLGSDDLPHHHPRLVKKVPSVFPEQIMLALSTPDSMWVSWVTGIRYSISYSIRDSVNE